MAAAGAGTAVGGVAEAAPITMGFAAALKSNFETANMAGIGSLYQDDSVAMVDGAMAAGLAAIAGSYGPRFPAGKPMPLRVISNDAIFTGYDASPKLIIMLTGDVAITGAAGVPAVHRFRQAFVLGATAAGGMYVKTEVLRFDHDYAAAPGAPPKARSPMPAPVAIANAADPGSLGTQFAQAYYRMYAENPASLAPLYREASVMTFEGGAHKGVAAIAAKLPSLPRGAHAIQTLDVVPVGSPAAPEGLLVVVTGAITLEGEANAMPFAQAFVLHNDAGGPYIANEMFRFVYG